MVKPEKEFQNRIIRILTKQGYLVLNCASKQIFDLVAIKHQTAYPLELKATATRYKTDQKRRQEKAVDDCQSVFFVIKQASRRGKMVLSAGFSKRQAGILLKRLQIDLGKYLI